MNQKNNIFRSTFHYLSAHKAYSAAIVFFMLAGTLFEGVGIGILVPFLQQVISPDLLLNKFPVLNRFSLFANPQNRNLSLTLLLFSFFLLVFFKNTLFVLGKRMMWRLRFLLHKELQVSLFDSLIFGGLAFFDSAKSGHMIHSFNRETERISAYIFNTLNLISISIQIGIYLLLLALVSWQLSSLAVCLLFLIFPIVHSIRKKRESLSIESNNGQADVNFILLEVLNGIRVVKLYIAENLAKGWFKESLDKFVAKEYRANVLQELIAPISETVIFGFICIVFAFVVFLMKVNMAYILPQLIVSIWILFRALAQVNSFNHFRTEMAGCVGALESYDTILERVKSSVISNGGKRLDRFREKIEFKNVDFGYTRANLVLKDISFAVPKGKVTAIVGSSGAGKTTIVNLIPRLYDAVAGQILVDGINLKDIDFYSWRRKIGFVSQDTFILNADVTANICFGLSDIPEDKVIAAAKAANIHDFLVTLPDGYGTILGERGVRFSSGQKQRISIARAIIRDPEILILDEATSSLDSESERLVQEAIERICRDRTVISIAHRLSTIQNADVLIVLESGRIVESGTHAELLDKNGRYAKLYNLQYRRSGGRDE